MPRDGRTLPHNILEEMRFRAIEAYQAGKGVAEIAKLLGVHWGSVSRWLTKWRRDGQRALKERKATGRPPKLDCKRHGKAILKLVKHPATEFGYEHPLWTCERIRQVISAELNLAVSVPTLWRELKKLKLSCQKPERRALEQDPKARARWIATEWPRIKRLARRQRALLFFEDESVVRLTPTVGRTWAPVGKTPIVRVTGKRASVLVMSALSLQGRLFFKIPSERVNATVFIDFLKELLAEYPKRKIFVIADQASPHIAKNVKAFVAGQKRLELFYLPTYSPDFNPDEGVWSHLKSQELKAHQATNKEELIKKTREALKRMAKSPALIRSFFKRCNITSLMKRPIRTSWRRILRASLNFWAAAKRLNQARSAAVSALKRLWPRAGDRCWSHARCGASSAWRAFLMGWRQKQTACKRVGGSLWRIEYWCWWPIDSAVLAASTRWRNGWRAILSVDVMERGFWLAGNSRVAYG